MYITIVQRHDAICNEMGALEEEYRYALRVQTFYRINKYCLPENTASNKRTVITAYCESYTEKPDRAPKEKHPLIKSPMKTGKQLQKNKMKSVILL